MHILANDHEVWLPLRPSIPVYVLKLAEALLHFRLPPSQSLFLILPFTPQTPLLSFLFVYPSPLGLNSLCSPVH